MGWNWHTALRGQGADKIDIMLLRKGIHQSVYCFEDVEFMLTKQIGKALIAKGADVSFSFSRHHQL